MAEERTEHHQARTKRRAPRLRWWAGVALLAAAAVLALLWLGSRLTLQSAEQQLAAIEAARAIPDSENAAVIYNEVLANTDLVSTQPDFLTMGGLRGPWLSADHPWAAEWLLKRRDSISRLMDACRKPQCRFPISTDRLSQGQYTYMLSTMRNWAQLLVAAANNDFAEGRVQSGLEECLCTIEMGAHLRQQLTMIDFLVGFAFEGLGLQCLNRFIVEGDLTETHLKSIEEALPELKNSWDRDWPQISEITELVEECLRRPSDYFRSLLLRFRYGTSNVDTQKRFEEIHLRILAHRRGARLLIVLRLYKNANGNWPQSLDEVKSLAPPEAFIDPLNGGDFVYKLTQHGFTLYSRGKNNIDENGNRPAGADDWLIWPRSSRRTQTQQPAR